MLAEKRDTGEILGAALTLPDLAHADHELPLSPGESRR
jgi:hypothetical protein